MKMRVPVLLTVAVACLTAVAPSAVARATSIPTSILVPVVADAPPTVAGHSVDARGVIAAGGSALPGASVELRMRPYGAAAFTTVGTAVSDSSGNLSLQTPVLTRTTAFEWVYSGDGTHDPTTASFAVYVASRATIHVSDRTPRIGQRVVVRGATLPNKAGNRVSVWAGTKPVQGFGPLTHHVRLVRGHVHADGTYRLVVRFAHVGERRIYVQVGGGRGNVVGFSRYRHVIVH